MYLASVDLLFQTGSPPSDEYSSDLDLGMMTSTLGTVSLEDETPLDFKPDTTPEDYAPIPVPGASVVILPANFLQVHVKKPK